jgi:precorrin-6B methylase 2
MSKKRQSHYTPIPPVWVMNIISFIHSSFYKLSCRMVPPSLWMMNHIENLWVSKALGTAIKLNISEHIDSGRNTIGQLAMVTQTQPDALFRLMRMLCAQGIFRLSKKGIYTLTPWSNVLLEGNGSVKYLLQSHLEKLHFDLFSEMDYTINTGRSASQKLYNKDIFSYVRDNPDEHEIFVKGMANTSDLFAPVLLSTYNFSPYRHIIDIGGGHGSLLCHILTKYKELKATLFDCRHVVERASANIESYGLKERIEVIEGDFFDKVPEEGDLYILKNILHDWGNEKDITILKNIRKVMKPRSNLLIIDTIIKNNNKYSYGKMIDILMLLGTEDGRERTLDEFRAILKKSGFKINKVIPTVSPFFLIECSQLVFCSE